MKQCASLYVTFAATTNLYDQKSGQYCNNGSPVNSNRWHPGNTALLWPFGKVFFSLFYTKILLQWSLQ